MHADAVGGECDKRGDYHWECGFGLEVQPISQPQLAHCSRVWICILGRSGQSADGQVRQPAIVMKRTTFTQFSFLCCLFCKPIQQSTQSSYVLYASLFSSPLSCYMFCMQAYSAVHSVVMYFVSAMQCASKCCILFSVDVDLLRGQVQQWTGAQRRRWSGLILMTELRYEDLEDMRI